MITVLTSNESGANSLIDINANFADLDTTKADLASPALTGNPTAPTQSANNNSTRIATTAYVDTRGVASTAGVSAGPASSSTQTITHGLLSTPTVIRIKGMGDMETSASARTPSMSEGIYNSTGNRCVYLQGGAGTFNPTTSTTFAVYLQRVATSMGNASGVIQNVGATTFDIVWTLTGSDISGGTAFLWEAQ